jgi:OPT family oligopeptide transporter
VFFFWIVAPALHFSGVWYAEYLPFFDSGSYDNTQSPYNVTKILTPDFQLDLAKYEAYSPLFLSTTFALCYGLSFAAIIAVIVNTIIFSGKDIYNRFRDRDGTLDDIHMKMMRKYVQVPWWWFGILFAVFTALAFVTCYVWPTELTWWAMIIALLISTVWLIPIAMIQAVTNIQIGLNVFTEFLIGYMLPGRPMAMMMFKTVSNSVTAKTAQRSVTDGIYSTVISAWLKPQLSSKI